MGGEGGLALGAVLFGGTAGAAFVFPFPHQQREQRLPWQVGSLSATTSTKTEHWNPHDPYPTSKTVLASKRWPQTLECPQ